MMEFLFLFVYMMMQANFFYINLTEEIDETELVPPISFVLLANRLTKRAS